jgi:hypothetical protein
LGQFGFALSASAGDAAEWQPCSIETNLSRDLACLLNPVQCKKIGATAKD